MPDFIHKPTLNLLPSAKQQVQDMDPNNYITITRMQYNAWQVIPRYYRKLVNGQIQEMTAG